MFRNKCAAPAGNEDKQVSIVVKLRWSQCRRAAALVAVSAIGAIGRAAVFVSMAMHAIVRQAAGEIVRWVRSMV